MGQSSGLLHNPGVDSRECAWILGLLLTHGAFAAPPQREPSEPRLSASTSLVLVPVLVTNKDYRPDFSLRAENFTLQVDRKPKQLAAFTQEDRPVSVVVVFDISRSMKGAARHAKEAIGSLAALAYPGDEYALIECQGQKGKVVVPFTPGADQVALATLDAHAGGGTPLYDSVDLALQLVKQARNERRVVFVVSDGEDTTSKTSFKQLRKELLETKAYLYVLRFWTGQSFDDFGYDDLQELTELSGGFFIDNVSPKRFAEYLSKVDFHRMYVLAFKPAAGAGDGKSHRIDVHVRGASDPHPRVFWRHSYQDDDSDLVR